MSKTTTIIDIQGMHCKSCELLIEDNLKQIPGVKKVAVNCKTGQAKILSSQPLTMTDVTVAVTKAGYSLGKSASLPLISGRKEDWNQLTMAAVILFASYFVLRGLGITNLGNLVSNNYSSLPIVFLVGLTAGVSTCMALVGGLILGVSSKFAQQQPQATATQKFLPHLYFNLGRILSFLILGGVIGWVGSVFQLSLTLIGLLTMLVGVSMLIIGAQLTEVFPRLSGWQLSLPKALSKALGVDKQQQSEYSHKNALVLGALTFFLPCGFTQAIQLYAMSTGSAVAGALTMGMFALGTAPGLLSIGGLVSVIKGVKAKFFFKLAGLLVMILAIYNMANGLNLTGWRVFATTGSKQQDNPKQMATAPAQGKIQVLKASYSPQSDVQPNAFVVKVNQPVRVEVYAQDNGSGCMGSFTIPGLSNKVSTFKKGQTIIAEFTPQKVGTYQMTCAMGVPHGTIEVKQ